MTRYVNQLRYEKKGVRQSRQVQRQSAYNAYHKRFTSAETDKEGLLHDEFNPYEAHSPSSAPVTPMKDMESALEGHDVEGAPDVEADHPVPNERQYHAVGQTPSSPPPNYAREVAEP